MNEADDDCTRCGRPAGVPESSAAPPESLAVDWFSENDCYTADLWEPARDVDLRGLFDDLRSRRNVIVQWNEEFRRMFTEGQGVR